MVTRSQQPDGGSDLHNMRVLFQRRGHAVPLTVYQVKWERPNPMTSAHIVVFSYAKYIRACVDPMSVAYDIYSS